MPPRFNSYVTRAFICALLSASIMGCMDSTHDFKIRFHDIQGLLKGHAVYLEESDIGVSLINYSNSMGIGRHLLAPLICFEQEHEDKRLIDVEKTKTIYESIVQEGTIDRPQDWSPLVICYALEGNRDRMESAIAVTSAST